MNLPLAVEPKHETVVCSARQGSSRSHARLREIVSQAVHQRRVERRRVALEAPLRACGPAGRRFRHPTRHPTRQSPDDCVEETTPGAPFRGTQEGRTARWAAQGRRGQHAGGLLGCARRMQMTHGCMAVDGCGAERSAIWGAPRQPEGSAVRWWAGWVATASETEAINTLRCASE